MPLAGQGCHPSLLPIAAPAIQEFHTEAEFACNLAMGTPPC
jgi:hypothetical protein